MKRLTKITFVLAAVLLWTTQTMAGTWQVNVDGVRYQIDNSINQATIMGLASGNSDATELVFTSGVVDGGDSYTYPITKVNDLAFYGKQLQKLDMSKLANLTSMNQQCFQQCKDLAEVVLPPYLKTLSLGSFEGCSSLKEISLPSTLTHIGAYAFKGTALTELTIPTNVTYVGWELFGFWDNIGRIIMENPVPPTGFDDRAFSEILLRHQIPLYVPEGSVDDYKANEWWYSRFGENIKSDDLGDIFDYGYLKYEVCEYGGYRYVDIVGGSQYYSYYDPKLNGALHDGKVYPVSQVRDNALQDYRWNELDLSGNMFSQLESIGYEACKGNKNIKKVVLPENVSIIYDDAFADCANLTSVTLPTYLNEIGNRAFKDCAKLETVGTGLSLKFIGTEAFSGCTALKELYPPANMESIGERAFYGTGIDYFILAPNVSTVGNQAFANTPNLQYVFDMHTSPSMVMVAMDMFLEADQTGKRDVTVIVPAGTSDIFQESHWGNVFDDIRDNTIGLTVDNDTLIYRLDDDIHLIVTGSTISTHIPYGYSSIVGLSPKCKNFDVEIHGIAEESLGKGWQEIGPLLLWPSKIGSRAFKDNKQLKSIDLTGMEWLSIEYQAFAGCTNLRSIGDNAVVQFVKDQAFAGSGIEEFAYDHDTQTIGSQAFNNCPKLKRVVYTGDYYGGVSIGTSAFENCKALEWLEIGSEVYEIGYSAFAGCTGLKRVTSGITSPFAIDETVFEGIEKKSVPLYVPPGCINYYKNTAGWKDFFGDNITDGNLSVQYDDGTFLYEIYGVTYDGEAAQIIDLAPSFSGTKAILKKEAITIDGKQYPIDRISGSAFQGLTGVEEMDFSATESKMEVETYAFKDASGLKSVKFNTSAGWSMDSHAFTGSSIQEIEICDDVPAYAFSGCQELGKVTFAKPCCVIGAGAFYECKSLNDIDLPKNNEVRDWGDGYGSYAKTEMEIGQNAFAYSGLRTLTIPNYSYFYINSDAFNSSNLTYVISYIEWPDNLDAGAFNAIPTDATLSVPYDSQYRYEYLSGWDHFYGNIYEREWVPTDVQSVEASAPKTQEFYDLQGVRQTNLKKGLNIIRQADGTTRKVLIK